MSFPRDLQTPNQYRYMYSNVQTLGAVTIVGESNVTNKKKREDDTIRRVIY